MMQPPTAQVWYARGPGENPFYFPPGGFRFLSPRRKEQRDCTDQHGNVRNFMLHAPAKSQHSCVKEDLYAYDR